VRAILAAMVFAAKPNKAAIPCVDIGVSEARAVLRGTSMANVSEFSIVTYLRKPGHWRAAIIPNVRIGQCIGGERVRSVVTQKTS
jgi:hypothetical protein